jgi:hypothetical protein
MWLLGDSAIAFVVHFALFVMLLIFVFASLNSPNTPPSPARNNGIYNGKVQVDAAC